MSGIINRALGIADADWKKSEKVDPDAQVPYVWWTEKLPTAMWTAHLQGASSRQSEYWVKKIQELTEL